MLFGSTENVSSWREAVKVVSDSSAYLIACELAAAVYCRRRCRCRRCHCHSRLRRCHLHLIVHLNCEDKLALCCRGLNS